ncbi:MAG: molybdopterin biosynthesis protein [Chloroflexi bacterium]|nr:molybdopterin biosynthesis protein [Chloroflexota bacterium]
MPLQNPPLEQALSAWLQALEHSGALRRMPAETIPLAEANGRITAVSVWARISVPQQHSAAMDGYALRAAETATASAEQPVHLRIGRQAMPVTTDEPIPQGYNALIPREHALLNADATALLIQERVRRWQHIRTIGEDIVNTQLILPANHQLRPADLGAIARSGHRHVRVYRRPRIAILPADSAPETTNGSVSPSDTAETNALVVGAMAESWGAVSNRLSVVGDDMSSLEQAFTAALQDHDLVVINAGSAAATAVLIAQRGEVIVDGIALRPGHTTILGHALGKPVLGITRYPVGAMLTFDRLVRPLIQTWLGQDQAHRPHVQATLTHSLPTPPDYDELIRVTLGHVGRRMVATPVTRGAGATMSMVQADGIIHLPRGAQPLPAGDTLEVELLRPAHIIEQSIIHLGSHDLTIDLLADLLRRSQPSRFLRSSHVGSLAGLLALGRGEAHIASAHLLDPATGIYNLSTLRQHLSHMPIIVLHFVERTQGLMVLPGNPKGIRTLHDLMRPDVSFVNRQAGSGTRVLLDYQLQQQGISADAIQGYERTEATHLAVAAAVKSSAADCALGILAAARSLHLDFLPLFQESYQLIIPQAFYHSELLAPLLDIIRSPRFAQTVAALGGYDVSRMGEDAATLP